MRHMMQLRSPLALAVGLALVSLACHETHIDYTVRTGDIGLLDDLYSVSIPDEMHAVAVGYYGAAYYTQDGGETWRQGRTDTLASLYKVSMGDAERGWAVGQRGLILRTEDGGETWVRQPNLKDSEGTHLFGVAAIDGDRAWVIGEWGTRIYTDDGGKTWTDHSFTVDERHPTFVWLSPHQQERVRQGDKVYEDVGLNDVSCLRAPGRRCWLIGEFGYIFYSDDRGETWNKASIEGSAEVKPVRVAYNELEVPVDRQEEFQAFAREILPEGHLNIAIEAVVTAEELRAFGHPEDPSELFEIIEARCQEVRTLIEDAGIDSSRIRLRNQPPWDYEDYLEDDPDFLDRYLKGRLAEYPGMKVRVIQNPILFSVRFRDDQNGLIAGLGGVILRSEDGGETWVYRKIDRKQALFSVRSVEGRAVAVGEKGLIRFSTDGGDNWRAPTSEEFPELFTFLRDVGFEAKGRLGFAVGQTGRIFRTTDGGYSWSQVLPPPAESS
jgi:photosystem II stability/assembly factor-like uncharacterized protein